MLKSFDLNQLSQKKAYPMKRIYLLGLIVLLTSILFFPNVLAQDYTKWRLPEGAKARYGKGWINDIEFSPSGDLISVATTIGVWTYDVHTGKEVNLFTGNMGGANAISYTSDGTILAAAHWDRTVGLWDVNSDLPTTPRFTFPSHPGPIYAVAISPNNRIVASGGADRRGRGNAESNGLIKMWDLQTKELLPILPYNSPVSTLAFSPNSRWIAGGSGDGTIRVWDAGTGDLIHEFNDHTKSVWQVDFSPDSKWLLSVSLDGTGFLKNLVHSGERSIPLEENGTVSIYAASFSPDEEDARYTFATGSGNKRIQLWKMHTNNSSKLSLDNFSLKGHNDSVWILAFSKDGQNLASGSLDGTVRLWDMALRRERIKIAGHTGGIKALVYTEDNRLLACGTGLDGILRLWDAGTSGQLSTLLDHANLNKAIALSNDGKTLASAGSEDDTILLSDVTQTFNSNLEDSLIHSLIGNQHGITALALSSPVRDPRSLSVPNRLVSGGKDARIHLLDITTQNELTTLRGAESTITALTFDPTSTSIFSGEDNGTIRGWDPLTGIEQFNFKSSFNAITALAFSPNPRFLAVGDEIGKIRLFDFAEGHQKFILTQHTRKITALVFAKDDNTLYSGSEDGTILLWDMNEIPLNIDEQNRAPQQDQTSTDTDVEPHNTTPQQIAQSALASTVALTVLGANGKPSGYGSGFFIHPGYIATNYHVIRQATRIDFKLVGKETTYRVKDIVATDPTHDLALLRVSSTNIPVLSLANSDSVQPGETVYIVGNPRGWEGTISDGIVSGIRGEGKNQWIQTTAPISPGNSGGAVLNSRGKVIGVATLSYEADYAQNLNFAVPSNYLKALLSEVQ